MNPALMQNVRRIEIRGPWDDIPYGYYRIVKVYLDGSYWLIATLDHGFGIQVTQQLAETMAGSYVKEIADLTQTKEQRLAELKV